MAILNPIEVVDIFKEMGYKTFEIQQVIQRYVDHLDEVIELVNSGYDGMPVTIMVGDPVEVRRRFMEQMEDFKIFREAMTSQAVNNQKVVDQMKDLFTDERGTTETTPG